LEWKEATGLSSQTAGNVAEAGSAPMSSAELSAAISPPQMALQKEQDAPEHVFPRWPWSWPIRSIRVAFLELVMRPLIWLLAAPRVVRETAELPLAPLLVIANHVTAYDGALILYALPGRLRRKFAIAMSGEMLLDFRRGRNQQTMLHNLLAPPAYWLVTALFNVFPLPRQRGFRKSFAHAGEAMDRGYSVLIFPEGTRSPDGHIHPFRAGIGLLAQQSRVPVVPVALIGLDKIRGSKTRWFRSGQLEVHVGEAVDIEEGTELAQLTAKLKENVRRLLYEE
jgi:long-chain acyl-CoA synthetase